MADVVREINRESGTVGGGSVAKTLEISVVKVGVSGDVARTMIIDFGQLQAQPTWGSIQGKPTFADVAFSGSYDDLEDKPDLSTKQDTLVSGVNLRTVNNYSLLGEGNVNIQTGEPNAVLYTQQYLTNEQKQQARGNIDAGTSDFSGSYNDLTDKPDLSTKQDVLVSGTNIKTINNESILGNGNIEIQGGDPNAVLFTEQTLTGEQQARARANIGAGTYSKPVGGIPSSDIASGVIPDVSAFITKSVNDLTNYYLKSETYTKAEVTALIGAIQQFHYEIYPTLPASGEGNVLYLIGPTGTGTDKYEEYVYANNDFTKIGDTSIDLSGYVTTSALNTALADYTTTANLTTLLAGKQDTISDLSTIRSGASLGATAYQKPSTGIPASDLASGVIPQPEVFVAEYGVTTYQEISSAISDGLYVTMVKDGIPYVLAITNSSQHRFINLNNSRRYRMYDCKSNDSWVYYGGGELETLSNKITSWQSTPDNTHYPSEKLVKDSIDAADKVFWATYGTTTAAEIDAAKTSGKVVKLVYNDRIYSLSDTADSSYIIFYSISQSINYYARILRSNDTWSNGQITFQSASNRVSTIAGNETSTTKYPNTKAVADALGKWGVVSQTQTWSGTGTQPRTYVMSDLVYGTIPQANIDLFESAGATFNATSGYFELNGLEDISYEEMKEIYRVSSVCFQSILNRNYTFAESTARTNFPLKVCSYVGYAPTIPNMFYASNTEIIAFSLTNAFTPQAGHIGSCFNGANKVKNVIGVLNLKNQTTIEWSTFYNTYSLISINISSIKASIELKQSSLLSLASVVYMVENAINTTAITITLHADALARCTADTTEYEYNGNTYTGIVALATAKNITLASA